MPTLAALIADHEAHRQPTEAPACSALTPRGHAALAILRLQRLLAELGPDDLAYGINLLCQLLGDVDAELARHFLRLAPAFAAIWEHVQDEHTVDAGVCCELED